MHIIRLYELNITKNKYKDFLQVFQNPEIKNMFPLCDNDDQWVDDDSSALFTEFWSLNHMSLLAESRVGSVYNSRLQV